MSKVERNITIIGDSHIKVEIPSEYGITLKVDMEFCGRDECRFLVSFYDQAGKIDPSIIDTSILLTILSDYNSHVNDLVAKLNSLKIRNYWFPYSVVKTLKYLFGIRRNVGILYNCLLAENIYTINNYDNSTIGKTLISSNKWWNILSPVSKNSRLDFNFIQHLNLSILSSMTRRKLDDLLASIRILILFTRVMTMIFWFLLNLPALYAILIDPEILSIDWVLLNVPWRIILPIFLWWLIPIILKKLIRYELDKEL